MPKNKFLKALKIMCVLAPILWSFAVLAVSYIGASISVSGLTSINNTDADNGLSDTSFDAYDIGINATLVSPISFIISGLKNSNIGQPIFLMYDWTITNILGYSYDQVTGLNAGIVTFPFYFIFLIFWYLIVELVFFIPEVIILFIRWCKNLMYKFMDKSGGGF